MKKQKAVCVTGLSNAHVKDYRAHILRMVQGPWLTPEGMRNTEKFLRQKEAAFLGRRYGI